MSPPGALPRGSVAGAASQSGAPDRPIAIGVRR
jgi:hypothetical protein